MAISTVIFDMGRVLIEFEFSAELAAIESLCSRRLDPADYRGPLRLEDLYTGRIDNKAVFDRLVEELGFRGDYGAFADAINQGFGAVVPGIAEVVGALSSSYRFALLSNTNAVHWEYALSNYSALLGKVTPHFVSHELGLAKPDAAIYQHVTAELDVAPGDCVFVDDSEPNIVGAREAGLKAILFTDSAQLVRDLASYGVDARG